MRYCSCWIFLALCVFYVNPMAIKGPALTRYDPCGLGIIHFDKVSNKLWKGVINFGLYGNLSQPQIEVNFDKQVRIYGASLNCTIIMRNDWHDYILIPRTRVPHLFVFYLSMDHLAPNETAVPIVTRFVMENVTLCDENIRILQKVDSLNISKTDYGNYKHVCGRRSLDHTELVSVRTESQAGDWPWHVAIFTENEYDFESYYHCGGNIISRTAVITAGHCIISNDVKLEPSQVYVVAGVNNHSDVDQIGRQALMAEEIILHPAYSNDHATSDLAIIKVDKWRYTEYVQPICIWGPVYDKTLLFGQQATVVGFGTTEDNKSSDMLRSAYTLIQNDTVCTTYSEKVYGKLLDDFTFCAGFGPNSDINPRNGDSGGGLVVPTMQLDHKISWFLRGVLSKCGVAVGHTECDPRFYVVYTDVGPHYGWIYHNSGLKFKTNIAA